MALDPVPWFVGGGAEHSPDVARMVAYAATGGAAGVLGNLDFRITSTPVPGTNVRIAAGAGVVPNGYLPAPDFGKQSYIARADSVTDIAVTATGSGAGRSDLVVLRMDDPQFGGQAPVDIENGPYVRFAIISNVAAGTTQLPTDLGYPALLLARIDLPASTGTVTQGMIVDLRKLPAPRRQRDVYSMQPTSGSTVTSSTMIAFTPQANRTVVIPSWATKVKVIAHIAGARAVTAALVGTLRADLGTLTTQEAAQDMDAETRHTLLVADTLDVPVAMRGTSQVLALKAKRLSGTGSLATDAYSTVLWDIEFLETPSAD